MLVDFLKIKSHQSIDAEEFIGRAIIQVLSLARFCPKTADFEKMKVSRAKSTKRYRVHIQGVPKKRTFRTAIHQHPLVNSRPLDLVTRNWMLVDHGSESAFFLGHPVLS